MINTRLGLSTLRAAGPNQGSKGRSGGGRGLAGKLTGSKTVVAVENPADALGGEPIDHAYLGRFTQGNTALEREVLELFAGMMPRYLEDLRAAETNKAWRDAVHTIKGSAAAVGARRLVRFAEMAERLDIEAPEARAQGCREEAIGALSAAVDEACRYIARRFASA
jgi:HPt (histidine-containing phosphotransfer) domain-containing protein